MDSSMIEATQALEFDDYEEETNHSNDESHETVGYVKVPCQKGFPGKSYPVIKGDNIIGRGDHCAICIPLKGLSREHACIEVNGDNHFIYDKGSRNKTRRNKFFLATSVRYELKDKDELTFGDVNCTYFVGPEAEDDDDETGSETGSESMFETALAADSLTIMDTPAPPARVRKGFADDLILPESDSDTDMVDDRTVGMTTLAADSQAGNESTEHMFGAPTQAFICESDVTTDEDESPKKKSILTAATQAYDMETASEEESPHRRSIFTTATQVFVADSDESPPKKVARKQIECDPTVKYDMTLGIESTQAYDMDEGDSTKDHEDDSDKSRLMCQATQAFHGDQEEEIEDEEDVTDTSKLLAEPTQAFLADKGANDDEDKSESSEEFVLEGDTDVEDDSEETKNIFAAPTLACDVEAALSEEEANDDKTQAIANDATQAVDDKTLAIADDATQAIDDKTLAIANDATQAVDDKTLAIADDATQAIDDKTLAIADDATQAIDDKTLAIADDATQAVDDKNIKDTMAINDDATQLIVDKGVDADETQVVYDEEETEDKAVNQEDIQTQVFDDHAAEAVTVNEDTDTSTQVINSEICDSTQVISNIEDVEDCKIEGSLTHQESDVFDINATSTLAPSDSAEFSNRSNEKEPEVMDNLDNEVEESNCHETSKTAKQKKNITELETQVFDDSTAKVVDKEVAAVSDQTVAVSDDTIAVSDETVAISDTVAVSDQTVAVSDETVAISDTVAVSDDTVSMSDETVAVSDDTVAVSDETVAISDTVSISDDTVAVSDETVAISDTIAVSDETVAVSNDTVAITDTAVEKEPIIDNDNDNIEAEAKSTKLDYIHKKKTNQKKDIVNVSQSVDKSDINGNNSKGRRGRQNDKDKDKDEGEGQANNKRDLSESTESLVGRRGQRGRASVVDYAALNKGKKDVKIQSDRNSSITQASKEPEKCTDEETSDVKSSSRTSRGRINRKSEGAKQEVSTVTVKGTRNKKEQTRAKDVDASGDNSQPKAGRGRRSKKTNATNNNINIEPAKDETLEPATYMEKSPQKGHIEEATQIYQDDDATQSLTEIETNDEEEDPLIVLKPELVAIPSRSPLRSAIASPQRKKSPSPKRVQFVSQSSATGSDSSQTGSRTRTSKRSLQIEPENIKESSQTGRGRSKTKNNMEESRNTGDTTTKDTIVNKSTSESSKSTADESKRVSNRTKRGIKVMTEGSRDIAENEQITKTSKRSTRGKISIEDTEADKDESVEPEINVKTDVKSDKIIGRKTRGKKSELNVTGDSGNTANTSFSKETGKEIIETDKHLEDTAIESGSRKATRGKGKQIVKVENKRNSRAIADSIVDKESETSEQGSQNSDKTSEKGSQNSDKTSKQGSQNSDKTSKQDSQNSDKTSEKGSQNSDKTSEQGSQNSDKTSEQSSQNSDNRSNTRRKTKSGPVENIAEDNKTVKRNARTRRTLLVVGDKCVKNESDKKNKRITEAAKDKKATSKPFNDEEAMIEEIRHTSLRGRQTKVQSQKRGSKADDTFETSKTYDPKESADKGLNRKSNDKLNTEADKTTLKESEVKISVSMTKPETDRPKRGRSKQSFTKGSVGVKNPIKSKISGEQKREDEKLSKPGMKRRAGKRKESDDSSIENVTGSQTPAKKQKLKDAPSMLQSSTTVSSPKSTVKKAASCETPKGKQLDTSVTGSPTLRKTTINGMKPKVMFTGVTDEQGEKIVKDLGGEMVSSVMECSHLVTDQIRRTVKFLCCLARGIPIVSPQWLISSKKCGFFSDTTPHLIRDDTSEKKFKCNLQRSINKASEMSLLTGYKIHVTKSVKPGPDQMKDILKCAGAQYLQAMPKNDSGMTVVVTCEDDRTLCEMAVKNGIIMVNAEFILTGILRQEVDMNSYLLFRESSDKKSLTQEPPSKKRKR